MVVVGLPVFKDLMRLARRKGRLIDRWGLKTLQDRIVQLLMLNMKSLKNVHCIDVGTKGAGK